MKKNIISIIIVATAVVLLAGCRSSRMVILPDGLETIQVGDYDTYVATAEKKLKKGKYVLDVGPIWTAIYPTRGNPSDWFYYRWPTVGIAKTECLECH